MALALSVTLAQAACVATAPVVPAARGAVRVTNEGQPFRMWEGALARKAADAQCGPRGVRVSIYDRFDPATGEWVYPEGCA
ncbi:MAG: hypothetical protein ACK40I_04525 [Tabrizicola sp.]